MGIFTAIPASYDANLIMPKGEQILWSVLSGIPAAFLWVWMMRWMARRRLNGLYDGRDWICGAVPNDSSLLFQLPCTLIMNSALGVGGILYLGTGHWLFVPHQKCPPGRGQVVEMGRCAELELALKPPLEIRGVQRFLISRPPRYIEVSWPNGAATVYAPGAEEAHKRLREIRRQLAAESR